jgi:hypothetical protein
VALEPDYSPDVREQLGRMGHEVCGEEAVMLRGGFSGGQGIMVDPVTGCF